MKALYWIFGIITLCIAVGLGYVTLLDIREIGSYTTNVRAAGTLIALVYGVICIVCAVRPERSNVFSKIGMHILWISFLLGIIFSYGQNPYIGRPETSNEHVFAILTRLSWYGGYVISTLSMITSLFVSTKKPA